MKTIIDGDRTLATRNSDHVRPRPGGSSKAPGHASIGHPHPDPAGDAARGRDRAKRRNRGRRSHHARIPAKSGIPSDVIEAPEVADDLIIGGDHRIRAPAGVGDDRHDWSGRPERTGLGAFPATAGRVT